MNTEEFQVHVVAELAKLNTHMTWLVGNGQPGKIAQMEKDIASTASDLAGNTAFTKGVTATVGILWVIITALATYWHFHPIYGQLLQQLNQQNH